MTALVLADSTRSTSAGSRHNMGGSRSAKTGTARRKRYALAVAMKVYGGTITPSPRPTPTACRARMSALVPLVTATQPRGARSGSKGESAASRPGACMAANASANAGYTLLSENSALHEAAQTNARRAGVADPRFGSDRLPVARDGAENTVWSGPSLLLADDAALEDIGPAVAKVRHAWG